MKNKVKKILKDIIIVWTVICTLLPTLCTGFAFAADDDGYLNTERAGNFAANFATLFYENWSSINKSSTYSSSGTAQSVLDAGQKIFDDILLGDINIKYIAQSGRDSEKIVSDRSYSEANGMDCSTFVSAALWLAGYEQFASTTNTYNMIPACRNGEYASYGMEIYRNDGQNVYKWNNDSSSFEVLSGVTAYEILQPGDIIVINEHTNIVKKVLSENSSNKYLALDCGNQRSWQEIPYYMGQGGGVIWDIWTPVNWNYEHYMCSESFLIRANGKGTDRTITSSGTHGAVKTEYDEQQGVHSKVEEDDTVYKFSNKSWINFVYAKSLFKDDVYKVFTGVGENAIINAGNFDDKNNIPGVKDVAKDSPILDITTLISEGKILPGDILYVDKGDGTYEYIFYVGGTKVIYATNDESVVPSGALKYEYLEYYLRRIKNNLRKGHESDENFEVPQFGVTQVYRIKKDVAENIKEKDANLFFNGKGYYSKVNYDGIPGDVQLFETSISIFKWLFSFLKDLLEFLINLIIYMIRMQVIGWTNLFENLLQHVLLGITGDNNTEGWVDALFGTSATSASGERITVESIFFNKIPILDANFFNFEYAGGHQLFKEEQLIGPTMPGQDRTIYVADSDNVAYRLRKNLATIYIVLRNLSIAILLIILVAVGIKIAITSIAEKKAEFKKFLTSWLYAMFVVLLMHFFMYAIFMVNDVFVGICENINRGAAKESVEEIIMDTNSDEELNLYDAVRTKAYAFNWKEGVPATIVYIFLVYLLIRFSFIYFKRYLTIYILALSSSFAGVKYAIERLLGKKTNSLNKWFKDFAFNVLLQTVHALIYTLFMAVAISVSEKSIGGAFVACIILNFMLKADKIIIKIFGLDKAGSLADVNHPESFSDLFRNFLPIYTISAGVYRLGKNSITGTQGFIRRKLDFIFAHNAESVKDANKIWEMKKFKVIGGLAYGVSAVPALMGKIKPLGKLIKAIDNKLPIRHLRMLAQDLSYDTKKKYYNKIKGYAKQETKRFTRKIQLAKDLALGAAGTIGSLGVMIAEPKVGIGMFIGARRKISKHKSLNRIQMKNYRYTGTKKKAREVKDDSKFAYTVALNKYTNNEMTFQEEYNKLLDDYAKTAPNSADRKSIEDKIKDLHRERGKQRSIDLHELTEAYEKFETSKIEYGNAKHEKNSKTTLGKQKQKIARGLEKVTGLETIENISMTETREAYETREAAKKQAKQLDDMQKTAKLEMELRKLAKDFKKEIQNIQIDGKKISTEEANEIFENYMAETVNEASSLNVKSNFITNAVNSYLYEARTDKVQAKDIDNILDRIQEGLIRAGKKARISDVSKGMIKEEMEKVMQKDGKGLGLEDKVASEIIRKVLGEEGTVKINKIPKIHESVADKQQEILRKLVQIHTYNEVGKIKHKSELVSVSKIVKDAKKKRK